MHSFKLPEGMSLENLAPLSRKADELSKSSKTESGIAAVFANEVDASLTWKFMDWLRTITSLPIFVKVILIGNMIGCRLVRRAATDDVCHLYSQSPDLEPGSACQAWRWLLLHQHRWKPDKDKLRASKWKIKSSMTAMLNFCH